MNYSDYLNEKKSQKIDTIHKINLVNKMEYGHSRKKPYRMAAGYSDRTVERNNLLSF